MILPVSTDMCASTSGHGATYVKLIDTCLAQALRCCRLSCSCDVITLAPIKRQILPSCICLPLVGGLSLPAGTDATYWYYYHEIINTIT
jgi:hypothetical protein